MKRRRLCFKIILLLLVWLFFGQGFFCYRFVSPAILLSGRAQTNFVFAEELMNINSATAEELDALPGIGAAKAQAIIDYREANGLFSMIEDIIKVSGIGSATYENIKNLITVGIVLPAIPICGDGNLDADEECDDGNTQDGDGCSIVCAVEGLTPDPPPAEREESQEDDQEEIEPTSPETTESSSRLYDLGDVLINEFVSDPADNEVEWIELYNDSLVEVDLENWAIEEGSGARTLLKGQLGLSGDGRFFVLEKPKGNLNNKGDIIILRDANGVLIDQVAYGDWDDGNIGNNAPAANDPNSIARKFDGQNSYNNKNDFSPTTSPTKGGSNIISIVESEEEEGLSPEDRLKYDYSEDILISEVFPNPAGSDSEAEFIELYNQGQREVSLSGWELGDESKKRYRITDINIKAGEYAVIYRSESNIALNNTNDSVRLYQPLKDDPITIVKYEAAAEGWSYVNLRIAVNSGLTELPSANKEWQWTEVVTPSEENVVKNINHPPLVAFEYPADIFVGQPALFDSSDTIDEDGDKLKFSWDFGDGIILSLPSPEHTFLEPGDYVVKLSVSDGENEIIREKFIKAVRQNEAGISISPGISKILSGSGKVIINEILPNPAGADAEGEFIEIKNISGKEVNLLNWKVDDDAATGRPYEFNSDLWLEPNVIFALYREESGLALNNSFDRVGIYNGGDELMDEINYEATIEGESYARGENGKFFWTTVLTPGEDNIISVAASDQIKELGGNVSGSNLTNSPKLVLPIALAEARELESGESVLTSGVVAVEPGILGSQYFYIVGSPGIQVYNYKKDFPGLKVGDYIEVQGELSVSNGEKRIKTKVASDMKIIENREAPEAEKISCDKISEEIVGSLISVSGEVTERKSSVVYLDDGAEEVIIYIKSTTGINPSSIKEGEKLSVTGIVGRTASGLRIMPRSNDDIIRKDIETSNKAGQVLGEVAVSDEWALEERNKKIELFKYLLVIAGGIIIALSGWLIIKTKKV